MQQQVDKHDKITKFIYSCKIMSYIFEMLLIELHIIAYLLTF